MEIRQLIPNDAEKYFRLRLEALKRNPEAFSSSYEEEKNYNLKKYQNRFKDDYSYTFGAFENEQLLGVVSLVMEQRIKVKHRANIFAMYVTPEKRGIGIAKKLLMEAINKARQLKNIEQIYLSVESNNFAAIKLYDSFGFNTYGVDKKALKIDNKYHDEEHMVMYI